MVYRPTRKVFTALALALAAMLVLPAAVAQTFRGGINGTVTDQSGAVVPGAAVEAVDPATSVSHKTISVRAPVNTAFRILPLGTYKISVTATGFKSEVVSGVPVTAGVIYTLPVKLSSVQSAGETVEVSASGLTLDTTSTTQTTDIPEETVQDVPLNGRDFTQLIGMAPGFAGYSLGGFGSVNGTRGNQVNWQIDGADNNDWWHNIPAVNQGGVENIAGVTSAHRFHRGVQPADASLPRKWAATPAEPSTWSPSRAPTSSTAHLLLRAQPGAGVTNPFNTLGELPLENVQWGASLGGPFYKDHTFWFTNFEKQKFNIATGNSGLEPNQYYQNAAKTLLKNANVPLNSATSQLLSILWPAILARHHDSGICAERGSGIRIQLQRRSQAGSHLQ